MKSSGGGLGGGGWGFSVPALMRRAASHCQPIIAHDDSATYQSNLALSCRPRLSVSPASHVLCDSVLAESKGRKLSYQTRILYRGQR